MIQIIIIHAHAMACRYSRRAIRPLGGGYVEDSTSIRFEFDCNSTSLPPLDDQRHDRAGVLRPN